MMEDQTAGAQAEWQAILEKYPSLKKFEELGDDYVEFNDGREEALLSFIKNHPDVSQLQDNPTRVLAAMDDFANKQDFLINIGSDKGKTVTDLIVRHKPEVLVEMGGYVGYSAIMFAEEMRKQQAGGVGVRLWSLEFDNKFASIASEFVALAGLSDVVTIVTGAADESMRKLKADGKIESVDFLFLDHAEDLYEQDLKVAMDELSLLKSGAVVVADNVVRPGAPEYRRYVRNHEGLQSEGIKGLIMPGEMEDELEVSYVL